MRYTISRLYPSGQTKYVYRDWPHVEWTDEEILALRMHPERAAQVSYYLMNAGISHTIKQRGE